MKKMLRGYILGILSAALLIGRTVYAANTVTLYGVLMNGIKIVVDGRTINPKDANGNPVEPMIYNGTTYLPVRAVADALGKQVYWDGTNYTVYLGERENSFSSIALRLGKAVNIGRRFINAYGFMDNYGNPYSEALALEYNEGYAEFLLNMKYSRFKGTIAVAEGTDNWIESTVRIYADGKEIYTSPAISKVTTPIQLDLDLRGCDDFKIEVDGSYLTTTVYFAECGFYQ